MYHPEAINRLRKELRDRMNEVADVILTSQLGIDEYRENQGVIRGLALAEQAILDMTNRAEQGDNDAG